MIDIDKSQEHQLGNTKHKLRTRFAPSPTGHLHIGHVAHAIFVWGLAQKLGATITLRLEDHDRARSRVEFEHSILRDLAWLGLRPDEGLDANGALLADFRQSSHPQRYETALAQLIDAGAHVYGCACSRKDIQASAGTGPGTEPAYRGTCRNRALPLTAGLGTRIAIADRTYAFTDLLSGRSHQQNPASQCGDVLLRDRDGFWTYQFAVVVDDIHDNINLIIRGEDILASTGRQLALRAMLGDKSNEQLSFVHHRLLSDAHGRKLAKRHGAEAIASLRDAGQTANEVLGHAAHLAALQKNMHAIAANELWRLFA